MYENTGLMKSADADYEFRLGGTRHLVTKRDGAWHIDPTLPVDPPHFKSLVELEIALGRRDPRTKAYLPKDRVVVPEALQTGVTGVPTMDVDAKTAVLDAPDATVDPLGTPEPRALGPLPTDNERTREGRRRHPSLRLYFAVALEDRLRLVVRDRDRLVDVETDEQFAVPTTALDFRRIYGLAVGLEAEQAIRRLYRTDFKLGVLVEEPTVTTEEVS